MGVEKRGATAQRFSGPTDQAERREVFVGKGNLEGGI
jgi:hypothetical protein